MIRVLQCVNDMNRAGLETMLMNYYRNIDRTKIQFDFLTHRPTKGDYDDEIISLGGRVYYAPRLYPQNYPAYFKYMAVFFNEHPEYTIVHSHIDAMSYLPLLAAKKAGIPVRIAHSHNTSIDRDFKYLLKQLFRFRVRGAANFFCACGQEAGHFLFGNRDFRVIPNAISIDRFLFDSETRCRMRWELGLSENNVVLGHVGRLSYQKNHEFLIRIFDQIHKRNPEAILLLIGVGEKEQQIRRQVRELHLQNVVRFLGKRSDVDALYQAMDVFVLPSRFEGIPVVGVEAQFADLPCVFSDRVPREVEFNDNCKFLPLDLPESMWADEIFAVAKADRVRKKQQLENSSYDIREARQILEAYYSELHESIQEGQTI